MDAPALVLVTPPNPLKTSYSPVSPHSHPSNPIPILDEGQERISTDTAIVTIYSMYSDDQYAAAGPSNSANASMHTTGSWSTALDKSTSPRKSSTTLSDSSSRDSFFVRPLPSTSNVTSNGSAYDTTGRRWSKAPISAPAPGSAPESFTRLSLLSNGSSELPYQKVGGRPLSTQVVSSSSNGRIYDDRRASVGQPATLRNSANQLSSSDFKSMALADLPRSSRHFPLPTPSGGASHSSADTPTESPPIRVQSPPPPPLPPKSIPLTSLSNLSPHPTSPRRKTAHSSPAQLSTVSSEPSEGEDPESFHVRNTYAQLSLSGVKGDGYEDGVELTRARLGMDSSRASETSGASDEGSGGEVNEKETKVLASVDRYGFFTVSSHERLISFPTAPLTKPLSPVSSVSTIGPTSAILISSLPPTVPPLKEASRLAKWGRMLEPGIRDTGGNVQAWSVRTTKERKLRERVYKGIPDAWRRAAWELLTSRYSRTIPEDDLRLRRTYAEVVDKPSTYDIQIDLDVPRTITGHVMFRTRYGMGQRSLFHVLHCFSLHCSECGYCQGMGPIAATLLCYFEPEAVYVCLVRLHDAYSMHSIFSPGFPGLLEAIFVQERITQMMMPAVYDAFKRHMVSTTSYATKWYITLFANSVPFQTQLRVWDAFFLEGRDVFVIVAVAVVWVYRDHLTSSSATFESILSLLSSSFVPEDENALLKWIEKALDDRKLRENIKGWREEWKGLVVSGEDRNALL